MKLKFSMALLCACMLALTAKPQILAQPEGMQFHHTPKFNPEFITANHVKEIRAVMETKRDGDRIRKTHREWAYQFDEKGQGSLQAQIDTRLLDTAITAYQFAARRIECEVKNDAAGMYSYCYVYNTDGQPTERRYARVEPWRKLTQPDFSRKQTQVNTETYVHVMYENQLHTTLHNSGGRPYQKETRYFDDHGYLIKYLRSFVMTSDRHEEEYTYNAHGWLASIEVTYGRNPHRTEYTYDAVGNLLSENRYEDGQMVFHKEYVYEGSNMLLRAELVRREGDELLEITTYSYKFR